MRDADFTFESQRVMRYFERWIGVLGFSSWRLAFHFLRSESERGDLQRHRQTVTLIEAVPQWEYESCRFNIFLPTLARLAKHDDDLEWHVVHELTHLWMNELHPDDQPPNADFMQHEERVCSRITTAILTARDRICREPETWQRSAGASGIVLDDEDGDGDVEGRLRNPAMLNPTPATGAAISKEV